MATGFQRTQFYAPSGIGWGDGKAVDVGWLMNIPKSRRGLMGKMIFVGITVFSDIMDFL